MELPLSVSTVILNVLEEIYSSLMMNMGLFFASLVTFRFLHLVYYGTSIAFY